MNAIQQIERSIRQCERLSEMLRKDCAVSDRDLNGKILPEYLKNRQMQLKSVEKIRRKLYALRIAMKTTQS